MVFNGDNLSRSTVPCIVSAAICNLKFIFEGTYLTSNLYSYDSRIPIMADFQSCKHCGSNAMWRTCLSTRTHASDTTTNSCNSFADRNFIFILCCSYASRREISFLYYAVLMLLADAILQTTRATDYLHATDYRQKTVSPMHMISEFPFRIRNRNGRMYQ